MLPNVALTQKKLADGDDILWYYTTDWKQDPDAGAMAGQSLTAADVIKLIDAIGNVTLDSGSAIAAVAPVIDAKDSDIAYALSATFLFDMAMIVLFPIMGRAMGLSDMAYGLWAGTAVNATSSVVAAGYAFSEGAGDFATMVKLTRTLAIIPTVVVFSFVSMHLKKKEAAASGGAVQIRWKSVFPWFILGFLAMAVLSSVGVIPAAAAAALKRISKFLMVTALAAVGLNTSFAEMKKSGAAPMVHGFLISALVVLVALAVEYFMGILPF